jgi:hypothetical protein
MPPGEGRKTMNNPGLPLLVRFLMRHAAIGFGLAIVFVGLLLALDIGGIATLIFASSSGSLALAVLTFSVGLTFSSVQMGFAVMFLRDDN